MLNNPRTDLVICFSLLVICTQSRDILATRDVQPSAIPISPSLHAPKTFSRRNVPDIVVVPDTNATIVTVPTLQSVKEAQVGLKISEMHIGSTE